MRTQIDKSASRDEASSKLRNQVPTKGSPLAGRYFYTIENGVLHHQGQIIAHLQDERLVLVQFYSWIMGEHTDQQLCRLEEVVWDASRQTGWMLFDDREQFHWAYSDGTARQYRADLKRVTESE
jgi:hypothetical protein